MNLIYPFLTIKNNFPIKLKSYYFIFAPLIFSFNSFAQVGINTTDPKTTLDVNGALSLRESPTSLEVDSGINRNVRLQGETIYSQYNIDTPARAFSIDGIATSAIADGQLLRLVNVTNEVMTIVHNSNGDEFKIVCPSDKNLILGGKNSSVTLQYSQKLRKWTVFSYAINSINKYSVFANTTVIKDNATPTDLSGLTLTFTPTNAIVYVTYNVFGDVNPGNAEGRFHLLMNGDVVNNTEMRTGSLGGSVPYQGMLPMFPLRVTPGIPVNLKVQWWRGTGTGSGTINNNPVTYPSHGRYITVID